MSLHPAKIGEIHDHSTFRLMWTYLDWLDATDQKDAFVRLFPVVEDLGILLAAIIGGNIPALGPIINAFAEAYQEVNEKIMTGEMTREEADRRREHIEQIREQVFAQIKAQAEGKKLQ